MQTPLFRPLTIEESAPAAQPILQATQKALGFLPNLFATFANAPAVLDGYMALSNAFDHTFTAQERQLILLTVSVVNDCRYCKAAHSLIAKNLAKVPAEVVAAIRNGEAVPNAKLDALVNFTREVVTAKGYVQASTQEAFLAAGYTKSQAMEVLLGVAMKTISNYLDHLSPTELDAPLQPEA